MSKVKRKNYTSDFKARVAIEAIRGTQTVNEIGQALDNIFVERLWRSVKHEDVYLKGYATMPELLIGLTEYFMFYNVERIHQSLGYSTPYSTATCCCMNCLPS